MVDDHALELHAQLHDGRQVLDAVERDLGDVQKPRHSADLHERSVRLDGLDVTVESDIERGLAESDREGQSKNKMSYLYLQRTMRRFAYH